jgi:hypothetical protein
LRGMGQRPMLWTPGRSLSATPRSRFDWCLISHVRFAGFAERGESCRFAQPKT